MRVDGDENEPLKRTPLKRNSIAQKRQSHNHILRFTKYWHFGIKGFTITGCRLKTWSATYLDAGAMKFRLLAALSIVPWAATDAVSSDDSLKATGTHV